MPFEYNVCDCLPLVIDNEFSINDEELLAEYTAKIILGHFAHVKRIIRALATTNPLIGNDDIETAIAHLTYLGQTTIGIEKRDGWLFQIISWLALLIENDGENFYCQQPHDASAQHGLDGIGIIIDNQSVIEKIIITEDKCTDNQRVQIPKVWKEFGEFEKGDHNNKLVSRISALIEHMEDGNVLEANRNNIYIKELRKYRVGINRNNTYETRPKREKLFKGYDGCVAGIDPHRRYASTLHVDDIRGWMEQFCQKVIQYLNAQLISNV